MLKKTDKDTGKQASTVAKATKAVAQAATVAKTSETVAKAAVVAKTATKTAETAKNVAKVAAAAGAAKVVKDTASKTRKKVSSAKKDPQAIHYFEINGEQISTEAVTERIKAAYKADGHRIGSIKNLDVYYNFVERRAYYVVNGKAEGKFVEF